jgi:hypothetical protein
MRHDTGAAFRADLQISEFMPGIRVTKIVPEATIPAEVNASLTGLVTPFQIGDAVILTFASDFRRHPVATLYAAIS